LDIGPRRARKDLRGAPALHQGKDYFRRYPDAGFGGMFFKWARSGETAPYGSFGNGSAMRVSPVGFAFETLEETLAEVGRSASVTQNHPEGIKGAQATAASIFLARSGASQAEIRTHVRTAHSYRLFDSIEETRAATKWEETCPGSVPQAISAFLLSADFEGAIRKAVSLGGDTDTIACIAGGIAEAFYGGVPPETAGPVLDRLDDPLRATVVAFRACHPHPRDGNRP